MCSAASWGAGGGANSVKPASLPEQDERRVTSPRETEMGFGAQANAQRPPSNGARGLAGKPRRCREKSEPDSPPAEFPAVRPYRRAAGERRVRPAREPEQSAPRRWRRGPRLLGHRGTARASRAGGPGRRAPASRRHWLGARQPRGRHRLPPGPCGLTAASSTASTRGAAAGAPRDSHAQPGRGPAGRVLAAPRGGLPTSVSAQRGHGSLVPLGAGAGTMAEPPAAGASQLRSLESSHRHRRPGAGVGRAGARAGRRGKGTVSPSCAGPSRAPGLGAVPGDHRTRTRQRAASETCHRRAASRVCLSV